MRSNGRSVQLEIDRHDADRLHRRTVAAGRAEAPVLLHLLLRGAVIDPIPLAKVTDQTFAAIEAVKEEEDE